MLSYLYRFFLKRCSAFRSFKRLLSLGVCGLKLFSPANKWLLCTGGWGDQYPVALLPISNQQLGLHVVAMLLHSCSSTDLESLWPLIMHINPYTCCRAERTFGTASMFRHRPEIQNFIIWPLGSNRRRMLLDSKRMTLTSRFDFENTMMSSLPLFTAENATKNLISRCTIVQSAKSVRRTSSRAIFASQPYTRFV
jgi:hypothetical protein